MDHNIMYKDPSFLKKTDVLPRDAYNPTFESETFLQNHEPIQGGHACLMAKHGAHGIRSEKKGTLQQWYIMSSGLATFGQK